MCTNSSFSRGNKCKIFNRYLPNEMSVLGECTGKVFCGIFSKDGNCFITASQGEWKNILVIVFTKKYLFFNFFKWWFNEILQYNSISVHISRFSLYYIYFFSDHHIRLHNSGDGSYKLFKSLRARDVGWSIIDVAFSPDRQHFVYSTLSSSCKSFFQW